MREKHREKVRKKEKIIELREMKTEVNTLSVPNHVCVTFQSSHLR